MKSYYEEHLKQAETISSLATHGFMVKVREVAEALASCSKDDVKPISEYLNSIIEAMDSVDKDVDFYKGKIEAEKEKSDELLSV